MRTLRSSWLVRTCLLLVFALLVGEQGVLHACPTHATPSSSVAEAPAAASHDHAASHDMSGDAPAPAGHHAECNCMGDCTSATVVGVANAAITLVPAPAAVLRKPPVFAENIDTAALRAYHRLPFANAPPRFA